jgi:hypothetical protein
VTAHASRLDQFVSFWACETACQPFQRFQLGLGADSALDTKIGQIDLWHIFDVIQGVSQ